MTAGQQQHGPPTTPENTPQTVAEILSAFYAGWRITHGVAYDRRASDRDKMAAMVEERGLEEVVAALPLFLACDDVRIVGADRLHPLGLFAANIGRLLATRRRGASWCDHEPQCRSWTQHRDLIVAEGRAERAAALVSMRH